MEANTLKRSMIIEMDRPLKRARLSRSGSDSESVYSVQQHDTDPAKDTSDTSIESDMTEYEVGRASPDVPNPFFSTEDSDELNEINEIAELGAVVAAVSVNLNDIDVGQLADTSTELSTSPTSNSDVDPELPRQDYLFFWTCAQCKAVNGNRHVPFCSACYTMRKNFRQPRPRSRRVRPRKLGALGSLIRANSNKSGDLVDGVIKSQSSSTADSGVNFTTSQETVGESSQPDDVVDGPSQKRRNDSNVGVDSRSDTCQTCLIRPADGLFVHGKTVHRYCCYKCAKMTWRRLGQCPLCRRQIARVLKLL